MSTTMVDVNGGFSFSLGAEFLLNLFGRGMTVTAIMGMRGREGMLWEAGAKCVCVCGGK